MARSSPMPTRCNVRSWQKQKPPLTTKPGRQVSLRAATARSDLAHCHRLEGLLLPLDDHDRPQSSSASRVTAGALGFFAFTQSRERPD